jgi:anaerobic ribonucleoside-triphosphate reductase activating protein
MLRVNYIGPVMLAQGPGKRYTIWVQGCSIHCPGCSNTDTWSFTGGKKMSVQDIAAEIHKGYANLDIDGVTITGGEPLDQFRTVLDLCRNVRPIPLFLTTGYTMNQIRQREMEAILDVLDIICVGPFDQAQVCSGEYKGSANQEVIALTDVGKEQLRWPKVLKEIHISTSGDALESGFTA